MYMCIQGMGSGPFACHPVYFVALHKTANLLNPEGRPGPVPT